MKEQKTQFICRVKSTKQKPAATCNWDKTAIFTALVCVCFKLNPNNISFSLNYENAEPFPLTFAEPVFLFSSSFSKVNWLHDLYHNYNYLFSLDNINHLITNSTTTIITDYQFSLQLFDEASSAHF